MFNQTVKAYPLCAWLLCAMSAPLAMFASGANWLPLVGGVILCNLLLWGIFVLHEGGCCQSKWYCAIQLVFLVIALAKCVTFMELCWPTSQNLFVMQLVWLALAVAAVGNGAHRAAGVGGVVFWLLALLFGIALTAGSGNIQLENLTLTPGALSPMLLLTLLLPVVITFLPRQPGRCYTPTLFVLAVFAVVICVWTAGTLSSKLSTAMENPFYEYSKSLSLFGIAERCEALVSVALSMGLFCLISLLLSSAGHLTSNLLPGKEQKSVILCALVAGLLSNFINRIPQQLYAAGALLFWGILPLVACCRKKLKKDKNTS